MGGFKQKSINEDFQNGFYSNIIEIIEKCCSLMKQNCISLGHKIDNNEVKIQNHLFHYYLDNNFTLTQLGCGNFPVSFQIETPESFDENTDTFIGRCDIKVTSNNYWINKNKKDYFIIECKRVDGSKSLNKKYINEGVSRFVEEPPKYPSHHNKNIMFGFVVKSIDIYNNSIKISKINREKFGEICQGNLIMVKENTNEGLHEYISNYNLSRSSLQLLHIFFDFSSIIK